MKVLHYVDENRLAWGETWIQLLHELGRQGVRNFVVCKSGGTLAGRLAEEGIAYDTCDIPLAQLPFTAQKLGRLIDAFQPDLIHTRLSSAARTGGYWGKKKKVPVIATVDKYPKLYYYKNASCLFPCSSAVEAHMAVIGFPKERMQIVYNPVLFSRYQRDEKKRDKLRKKYGIAENDIIILSAGRFIDWKGFEYTIQAYAKMLSKQSQKIRTHLWLVGDGPERKKYLDLVAELGLDGLVQFMGFAQDIRPWLWASDLMIQPSQKPEGFSLMLLEAMAARLPVVATNIGGTLDIIRDNENGWLMEVGDFEKLSSQLEAILADREHLKRIGLAAEKTASCYDVAPIAEQSIALYKKSYLRIAYDL